jgi:hypothetical protein
LIATGAFSFPPGTDDIDAQTALDALHQLLAEQSRLADETHEANRLKILELEQKQRELDQVAKRLALDEQAQVWRERRLDEIVQRYIKAEELLITLDDAFGETVQRAIDRLRAIEDAQRDLETAVLALLTRAIADLQESYANVKAQRSKYQIQELLTQHYENLHELEQRAARRGDDVPVSLMNEIERERAKIEELEAKPK